MGAARIVHLLTGCCKTKSHAQQVLAQILAGNLRSDSTVAYSFISACDALNLLSSVAFPLYINSITKPHTFVCNALLRAYSHSSVPRKSLIVYSHMNRNAIGVNHYTFPFVLKALADLRVIEVGKSVHSQVIKLGFTNDVYVGNSLLNLYAASGDMFLCGKVFDEMPLRDVVSWTVMISGYKEAERFDDALIAFEKMRSHGVMPNQVTAVNALPACGALGALDMGIWIHDHVRRNGWELDVILGTALIDMYGKCGQIDEVISVFEDMSEKNVFTWNAVIMGLALSKNGKEAIKWFRKMNEERVCPDEVTLIAVLSACVHSGFVHMGRRVFASLLVGRYGFKPNVKHYSCIVGLLARSNCLDEAVRVIKGMPFEPTVSVWGSVLLGSRAFANFGLSELAAWKLVELEPQRSAHYVVLSNLYADMGRWSDVEEVRKLMKDRGLTKDIGGSKIEMENNQEDSLLVAI
ncbi:pentatricopeptide repeat-containing protein At5g66520-like [Andrographis paniculata]|uniref:pentatricopeptide repeat-containing protein At5g66520-like n=1 Tax=Andrographis paniculata TaxID=175694 RepID=UPI0021E78176|nr:pentatricopeptide repeat-containing protein At5g66520-like [Andrographis paniculata]